MTRLEADVVRYGWIGATRRAALRKKVSACVASWLSEWHAGHDGAAPDVNEAPVIADASTDTCVLKVGGKSSWLIICVSNDELARLGNWLAGIRESTAALSHEIGRLAFEDIARRMAQLVGKGEIAEQGPDTWPPNLVRAEFGAVGLTCDIDGVKLSLALSRDALDLLCPPHSSAPDQPLCSRAEAIHATEISLTAAISFGNISVRELADLRIGEVLVGECSLDTPVRVIAPGGNPIGHARMGRFGDRLGIALTQPSTLQEHA